ncbi:MAG TPA: A/G-specific adenine glycosylase [Opitutaceae bacterium]|nr:A/G-specific adenine glycosylase [Opitutaceae bacterium]
MPAPAASLITRKADFQRALLGWYRANARALPWREAPSLYQTVVSEFMLQQTQVKTVLPYFTRWLAEFPDFAALAAASEARVLKRWEGLGYYARARNLHRLAKALAARPEAPRTTAEWRELPGVGPYTAAAIVSIAFGDAAACVDGNVVRILARLTANGSKFRDSASAARELSPLAEALLAHDAPGEHNQAMMELGATLCTKGNPQCPVCPVRALCATGPRGDAKEFPRFIPKTTERRSVVRVWCEREGKLLLHRAAVGARRLAELHELPTAEQAGLDAKTVAGGRLLLRRTRAITRWQITESIYAWPQKIPAHSPELVWVSPARLEKVSLSGPHRRWVREILHR